MAMCLEKITSDNSETHARTRRDRIYANIHHQLRRAHSGTGATVRKRFPRQLLSSIKLLHFFFFFFYGKAKKLSQHVQGGSHHFNYSLVTAVSVENLPTFI